MRRPLYPRLAVNNNLPPGLTDAEKQAAAEPGLPARRSTMADETPEASPTGVPWLSTKLVPFLAALGAVAFVVAEVAADNTIADSLAKKVLYLLTLVGVSSPGWRKQA